MANKMKIFLYSVIALAFIFLSTYFLTDLYMGKFGKDNFETEEAAPVSDKSALDDSTKVSLFAGNKKEKELTIEQLKKDLNINGDLSQSELIKRLKDEGYNLDTTGNAEISFKKDTTLVPNKYYIGDKDNYLAIYKTDDNGKPNIESDEDIYSDNKNVDSLSDEDKYKIRNFIFQYDSKEDAEEALSEFLS